MLCPHTSLNGLGLSQMTPFYLSHLLKSLSSNAVTFWYTNFHMWIWKQLKSDHIKSLQISKWSFKWTLEGLERCLRGPGHILLLKAWIWFLHPHRDLQPLQFRTSKAPFWSTCTRLQALCKGWFSTMWVMILKLLTEARMFWAFCSLFSFPFFLFPL